MEDDVLTNKTNSNKQMNIINVDCTEEAINEVHYAEDKTNCQIICDENKDLDKTIGSCDNNNEDTKNIHEIIDRCISSIEEVNSNEIENRKEFNVPETVPPESYEMEAKCMIDYLISKIENNYKENTNLFPLDLRIGENISNSDDNGLEEIEIELSVEEDGIYLYRRTEEQSNRHILNIDDDQDKSSTKDTQLAGYVPDCGTKDYKFLSYAKMIRDRGLTHPMKYSDKQVDIMGNFLPENYKLLETNFGAHAFIRLAADSMVLSRFGIGMVLYFKFLKFMCWIFFVCFFFFSLPTIVVYTMGGSDRYDGTDGQLDSLITKIKANPMSLLGFTTIGHLGESTNICMHGKYNSTLSLECGTGTIGYIKSVYAMYNDQGTCSCPVNQQVDQNTGKCLGKTVRNNGSTSFICPRTGYGCFLGTTPLTNEQCCSYNANIALGKSGDQTGNFSDFNLKITPDCQSSSASHIVSNLCLGKKKCNITIDENYTYPFPCNDSSSNRINCTFSQGSNFSGCQKPSERGLIVFARCFATDILLTNDWTFKILGWHQTERINFLKLAVLFDFMLVLGFLISIIWLNEKESDEIRKVSTDEITAQKYTVQLLHLPRRDDVGELEKELKLHLETILSKSAPVYRCLEHIRIADINFGLTNAKQIDIMRKRGAIARKLDFIMQKINKFKLLQEKLNQEEFERRLTKMIKISRKLDERLSKFDSMLDQWDPEPNKTCSKKIHAITAFITFEEEEGYLRCIREYPDLGPIYRMFQPKIKRFLKKRMNIQLAPDPSDIIWENLDYTWINRTFRKFLVNLATLSLLLISFSLIYLAKVKKTQLEREFGHASVCPTTVTKDDVLKDELRSPQLYNKPTYESLVECYCKSKINGISSLPRLLNEEFYDAVYTKKTYYFCYYWAKSYLSVQVLTIVAVVSVIIINIILKITLNTLVLAEKHHTLTEQIVSIVKKIFLSQFINTSVLVILINANFNSFITSDNNNGIRKMFLSLFSGKYSDFSVSWYEDVGSALLLTMVINTVAPHVSVLITYLIQNFNRWKDRDFSLKNYYITKQSTQKDLENLHSGPNFDLATRYSEVLNIVFMALLFSSGMPIVMLFAFLSLFFRYWADKFTFLRIARTPPFYDGRIAAATTSFLPYAILLHLCFAIWMFSNKNIFYSQDDLNKQELAGNSTLMTPGYITLPSFTSSTASNWTIGERIKRSPVVYLSALLLIIVTIAVVKIIILGYFLKLLQLIFPICFKKLKTMDSPQRYPNYFDAISLSVLREKIDTNTVKISLKEKYKEALERRLKTKNKESKDGVTNKNNKFVGDEPLVKQDIVEDERSDFGEETFSGKTMQGCHSYDIIDNKDYIEAFAIDSQCATKRRLYGV